MNDFRYLIFSTLSGVEVCETPKLHLAIEDEWGAFSREDHRLVLIAGPNASVAIVKEPNHGTYNTRELMILKNDIDQFLGDEARVGVAVHRGSRLELKDQQRDLALTIAREKNLPCEVREYRHSAEAPYSLFSSLLEGGETEQTAYAGLREFFSPDCDSLANRWLYNVLPAYLKEEVPSELPSADWTALLDALERRADWYGYNDDLRADQRGRLEETFGRIQSADSGKSFCAGYEAICESLGKLLRTP